jgi:hypothetical protein
MGVVHLEKGFFLGFCKLGHEFRNHHGPFWALLEACEASLKWKLGFCCVGKKGFDGTGFILKFLSLFLWLGWGPDI